MNRIMTGVGGLALIFILGCGPLLNRAGRGRDIRESWTADFHIDKEDFVSTGRNPYFVLEPGYTTVFRGKEQGKNVVLTITVLNDTERVDGVMTRIVEERETEDGHLVEVSRNFFAADNRTGAIFYFGEDVDTYEEGEVKSHAGSWRAGVHGARFGLMMPARPLMGARYYQERADGIALDRAEIISVTDTLKITAGEFAHCIQVEETTPLEPGVREFKVYAPSVGLIQDGALKLSEFGFKTHH